MTNQHLRIIEVAPTWPAEVFIQRHVQALLPFEPDLQFVACSGNPTYSYRASIGDPVDTIPVTVLPSFRGLSLLSKIYTLLRYGISKHLLSCLIQFILCGSGFGKLREGFSLSVSKRIYLSFFQSFEPDLIHFHNAQLAANMHWIPEKMSVPYTVSLRGADVQEIPLRSKVIYKATYEALKNASGIHSVCEKLGRSILSPKQNFKTIYTPIPMPERLAPYPKNDDEKFHFLSVGRIHWRKAYPDLLVSLRNIINSGLNADLTIVGGGPDEDRVSFWIDKLQLQSSVCMITKASFPQIVELQKSSHAYIQASLAEGLSNAMAEAMAWGCPVFATDVGGTREIIQNGQNGFLLEPAFPERWGEILKRVEDRTLMKEVRGNAHQFAQRIFSPEHHGKSFQIFFQQSLEKNSVKRAFYNSSEYIDSKEHLEDNDNIPIDIVIWGSWEWQLGCDTVLKVLSSSASSKDTKIIVVGAGNQEDELRYLASLLNMRKVEFVKLSEEAMENVAIKERWLLRTKNTIELVEVPRLMWLVTVNSTDHELVIGDTEYLAQLLVSNINSGKDIDIQM